MKKILALVFILIIACPAHAEKFIELRIINVIGGPVRVVMPDGERITLGRVLLPPEVLSYNAYTASKWASPSTVSASAVNAIHILVDVSGDRGAIFSIIPSATTIIRRGVEFPLSGVPGYGDVLVIRTPIRDAHGVYMTDFENRPGGRVIVHTGEGMKVIARVVRRVRGAGRFGGFQIIPLRHALMSHELHYVWRFTQYMVVAPLPGQPDLEGRPPLFSGELMPGPHSDDKESNIAENGKNCQKFPEELMMVLMT